MNHVPRSKLVLQELSKRITSNESTEQIPHTVVDIPLRPCSGRHVNRQEIAPEAAQEVALEQTQDISLPQSSGSNVQQPATVEENVQDLVQKVANPVVIIHRSGRVIRKPERFTLSGESYDRIPEEPNTEPVNYAKALHDKDAEM
ncbi:hypothetical protein KY285_026847 [Solanum tuberosum]|nr:hypothetical protein KY289_027047 [Solanum tuberosum]KAH0665641.1 hypothetical protein KY285_026847 [Solanum tuberosum]